MLKISIVSGIIWIVLLQVPPPAAPWVMIAVAVITAIPASIITAVLQDRIARRKLQAQEHISVTEAAESVLETAERARARYEKGVEEWYQRQVNAHEGQVTALENEHKFHLEKIAFLEAEIKRLNEELKAKS